VRTLPEALAAAPDAIVTVPGEPAPLRMIGTPIRLPGYHPDYRPAPRLGDTDPVPETRP
jgi:hypothetical protein